MAHKASGLSVVFQVPHLCLIGGVLLVLASMGELSFGDFGFRPSEIVQDRVRVLLACAGLILVLLGATLVLHRAGVWATKLGALFFASTSLLIGGLGLAVSLTPATTISPQEIRIFNNWDATVEGFVSQVESTKLAPYAEDSRLLLVCRKHQPAIPFERDRSVQRSATFPLDVESPLQTIGVEFSSRFADELRNGDLIECALSLFPDGANREDIHVLDDIEEIGGSIVDWASDDISAVRTGGPPQQ